MLVAEDNPDHRLLAGIVLRKLGFSVVTVEDGPSAVEAVSRAGDDEPFDLLLLDVHMPRLDGCEATRLLRDAGHQGPIFAVTAYCDEEAIERCRLSGFDFAIAKPLSGDALAEASAFTMAVRRKG